MTGWLLLVLSSGKKRYFDTQNFSWLAASALNSLSSTTRPLIHVVMDEMYKIVHQATYRFFEIDEMYKLVMHEMYEIVWTTSTCTTQFYQSYIANNKPNKRNPNNQNNDINVDFTNNTKFMLLQLRQRKFCSIHIQTLQEIGRFRTFHPSQILHI